jgi:hypothetical protein
MQLPSQFLSAVLPVQGWRIFNFIMPGAVGDRAVVQHDFQPNGMLELERLLDWAIAKQADVYFAVGAYGSNMRPIKSGKRAGEQVVSRAAANAILHRCLRLDVDCGQDKPYATKHEGWQATKEFLSKTGLPLPLTVDSGYGLHLYWLFDRDVDAGTWLGMAQRLAAACETHGFAIDGTATTDAARILRLPGTFNFKHGTCVPVTQLCDGVATDPATYDAVLGSYRSGNSATISGHLPAAISRVPSPLSSGLHPPYTLRGVLLGCPGMTAQLQKAGAGVPEPLWHATLALINRAADPLDKKLAVAQALSSGHATYTPEGLDAKWEQVVAQDYEPATCERFAQLGMPECQTCPLRLTMKAPCVLGRAAPPVDADPPLAVQPPAAPLAPPPPLIPTAALQTATVQGIFSITPGVAKIDIIDGALTASLSIQNGIPCVVTTEPGPDGQLVRKTRRIGIYALVAAERMLDEDGDQSLTLLTFNRHTDGYRRVEFSHADLTDARALNRTLHASGVYLSANDAKLFQEKFMPQFLGQLQQIKQANAIAGRCGWSTDFKRFVLGTRVFDASGDAVIRPTGAPEEMEAYHTAGDHLLWRQAFDMVLAGGADRQAVLALGIAGPLMAFTGVDGVLLNAYSPETGVGKSTLCDALLSIWGAPNKLRKDYRDTPAATFKLAAVSGNMPLVIDEFTNVDGKELSNYVYTLTQGRERHRLDSASTLRKNANRWCLPAIATSNNSVHDKLQSFRSDATAEAARVFEIRMLPLQVDPAHMGAQKRVLNQLNYNYGSLGPQIVQLFMSKPESYWRDMVSSRIAWWDEQMAETTGDRFRSVVAALVDLGATLGTALGYTFDRAAVIDVMRTQWRQQVVEFEAVRVKPVDFVTGYLTDHLLKLAVFGGNAGDQLIGQLAHDYAGEIRGIARSSSTVAIQSVMVPLKLLRQYIIDSNGNPKAVTEWLQRELQRGGCVQAIGQMTFLSGTPRSIRQQGVKFSSAIMGVPTLTIAPNGPPTLAQGATP